MLRERCVVMLTWIALGGDLASYAVEPRLRFQATYSARAREILTSPDEGPSASCQSKPRSLQAHKLSWTK